MNYYIQGDAAKADKIKAAFEKLGYEPYCWTFQTEFYFTVDCTKTVQIVSSSKFINIIKTHPDYKELELPVEPKFKVGDKVIYNGKERTITFMDDTFYDFDGGCAGCRIEKQDELLSPAPKPHYDIANFNPFDKVLVRDNDRSKWRPSIFSYHIKGRQTRYPFCCIGNSFSQCIPFEGNENLLGTTDMCDEQFINW